MLRVRIWTINKFDIQFVLFLSIFVDAVCMCVMSVNEKRADGAHDLTAKHNFQLRLIHNDNGACVARCFAAGQIYMLRFVFGYAQPSALSMA